MTDLLRQLPLALPVEAPFDAQNLVITESNYAVSQLVEQWPDWHLPVALIIGPEGAGKSHFAAVWAQKTNAYRARLDMMGRAVEEASNARPILLEDIAPDTIDETGLFHLINAVRQMHAVDGRSSLLMTSAYWPSQWGMTLRDLQSRLKSVTFVEIKQPDDTLLEAVLMKLFADRQLTVDLSIISYIARHMERSLSEARMLVEAIDRRALQKKAKITRPFVMETIAEMKG